MKNRVSCRINLTIIILCEVYKWSGAQSPRSIQLTSSRVLIGYDTSNSSTAFPASLSTD